MTSENRKFQFRINHQKIDTIEQKKDFPVEKLRYFRPKMNFLFRYQKHVNKRFHGQKEILTSMSMRHQPSLQLFASILVIPNSRVNIYLNHFESIVYLYIYYFFYTQTTRIFWRKIRDRTCKIYFIIW